jgi:hypothetical protein
MHDPRKALLECWQLVRVGGHLFFIVPDEALYEQGVFPSRFNADHKATFTISKAQSWSPISINVLDLEPLYVDHETYSRKNFVASSFRRKVVVSQLGQGDRPTAARAKARKGRLRGMCASYDCQ